MDTYDKSMHDRGFVLCILPTEGEGVAYCYSMQKFAGDQIGWKVYTDGTRLPVHAVKQMEGDSLEALGRLKKKYPLAAAAQ